MLKYKEKNEINRRNKRTYKLFSLTNAVKNERKFNHSEYMLVDFPPNTGR